MKKIKPAALTAKNFESFGRFYDLHGSLIPGLGEWKAALTSEAPVNVPVRIGITAVKGGDFTSVKMERHVLSEEILLCADNDMVLTVANSDPEDVPLAKDIRCFYMCKGQVVVLAKGIWHDANHGVNGDVIYYFLIEDLSDRQIPKTALEREVEWVPISPEPIDVAVKE